MYGPMDNIRNKPLFDRLSRPGIDPVSAYYKLASTRYEDEQLAGGLGTAGLTMAVISSVFTVFGSALALPAALSVPVIGVVWALMIYVSKHDELNRLEFVNKNVDALYDELHGGWCD